MMKTLFLGELMHLCISYASMSILYHHKKANFSERTVKLYHVTPVLICNVTLRYAMQRLLGISLSDQLIVALRLLKLFVNIWTIAILHFLMTSRKILVIIPSSLPFRLLPGYLTKTVIARRDTGYKQTKLCCKAGLKSVNVMIVAP